MDILKQLMQYSNHASDLPYHGLFRIGYIFCILGFLGSLYSLLTPFFRYYKQNKAIPEPVRKSKRQIYSVYNLSDLLSSQTYKPLVNAGILVKEPFFSDGALHLQGKYGNYYLKQGIPREENTSDEQLLEVYANAQSLTSSLFSKTIYFFQKEYALIESFLLENELNLSIQKDEKNEEKSIEKNLKPLAISIFWLFVFHLLVNGAATAISDHYYSNGISGLYFDNYSSTRSIGQAFRNFFEEPIAWAKDTSSLPVTVYFQGKCKVRNNMEEKDSYIIITFTAYGDSEGHSNQIFINGANATPYYDKIMKSIYDNSPHNIIDLQMMNKEPDSFHPIDRSDFPYGIYSDNSQLNFLYLESIVNNNISFLLVSAKPGSEEISFTSTINVSLLNDYSSSFNYVDDTNSTGTGFIQFDPKRRSIFLKTNSSNQNTSFSIAFDGNLTYKGELPEDYHSNYFKDYYKNSPFYN